MRRTSDHEYPFGVSGTAGAILPEPLTGHDAWSSIAAPAGVVPAREEGRLPVEEFITVVQSSGFGRPIDDVARMQTMLTNSNLVITLQRAQTEC